MKNVLLIGLGRFGRHIAEELVKLGHDVMAIDNDESRVNSMLDIVTDAQIGDSTNEEFLRSLEVDSFDLCIVAIGDNFQNSLETTSLLKELGAVKVVSRAARDVQAKFLLRNGADDVVYPERQLASWTAIKYTSDHILDYIELEGDISIYELAIPKDWRGKSIGQIDVRKRHGINILALKQNGNISLDITPDTVLSENMTMLVFGSDKNLQKCFHI